MAKYQGEEITRFYASPFRMDYKELVNLEVNELPARNLTVEEAIVLADNLPEPYAGYLRTAARQARALGMLSD